MPVAIEGKIYKRAGSVIELTNPVEITFKPDGVRIKNINQQLESHRTKVFISYSHKDTKYLSGLSAHLEYLEKNKLIEFWADTKIKPGEKWQDSIKSALASTKVAILLISIDFLNSQFIADNELPPLLAAAEGEGVKILPVILRQCILPKSLSQFQAINSPLKPLSRMKGYEREELWVKIAKAIAEAKVQD